MKKRYLVQINKLTPKAKRGGVKWIPEPKSEIVWMTDEQVNSVDYTHLLFANLAKGELYTDEVILRDYTPKNTLGNNE